MRTAIQELAEPRTDSLELLPHPERDHRSPVRTEFGTLQRPQAFLDTVVTHANRLTICGVRYKPYWMMCDFAMGASLIYAWVFSHHFRTISGLGLGLAIVVALLIYKLVLELKGGFRKKAARSFLQDCLLVIIPSFLAVTFVFRQPLPLALAFLGTLMPLYGSLARLGCFLGGCCFGKPSELGILYPESIFLSADAGCRRFSPSPNPGTRVFPIQLVESAAQATLFVALAIFVWHDPGAAPTIFWVYLSTYAIVRFILDFYRTTSARPRYGPLSEAQVVCVLVQGVSLAVLISIVGR